MLFPFVTIGLTIVFLAYVAYLAFVKKNLSEKFSSEILPGIFVLGVWVFLYFTVFR